MFSIIGTLAAWIILVLTTVGLAGLFALMIVESFGLPPIPSEVILPFTGYLVVTGVFPLVPAIGVALAGSLVGSFAAYAVGRWWRDHLLRIGIGPVRLRASHLDRVDGWFRRHGEVTVGLARMAPVIRSYISYPAGTARMNPVRFGTFTLLGSVPFTLALIYAGMLLGAHWRIVEREFQLLDYGLLALVVAAAAYFFVLYYRARQRAEGESAGPIEPAAASPPEPPR
jgi:membrane protein DedA with SNARE-associated domain